MKNRRSVRSWIVIQENLHTTRKEVIQMKKREGLRSWMYVILMAVAVTGMSLLSVQLAAAAYTITATAGPNGSISPSGQVNVTSGSKTFTIAPAAQYVINNILVDGNAVAQLTKTYTFPSTTTGTHTISVTFALDTDGDGFSDAQERSGILLKDNTTRIPPTNPNVRDLFVILVRADDPGQTGGYTNIARTSDDVAHWFNFVSNSVTQGGLGYTVHLITAAQADSNRYVSSSSTQKAVRVTESLDVSDPNVLGFTSSCGTPNGLDLTTVYTERIKNLVTSILNTTDPVVIDLYIKHTIVHEIGHTVGPLAPVYNSNYGGYHYQSAANNLIMDQSVYHTGTTFYIGTTYTSADQAGAKLK